MHDTNKTKQYLPFSKQMLSDRQASLHQSLWREIRHVTTSRKAPESLQAAYKLKQQQKSKTVPVIRFNSSQIFNIAFFKTLKNLHLVCFTIPRRDNCSYRG